MATKTPEEKRAYHRAWTAANRDHVRKQARENLQRRRKENPEKYRAKERAHYAAHPEQGRSRQRKYRQGRQPILTERLRKWIAANHAHVLAYRKQYYQDHKETILAQYAAARARRRNNQPRHETLTAAQWRMIKEHYQHRCIYCHRQRKNLTQDHITPLTQGGKHTIWNVVPACRFCNAKKRTGPPLIPIQPLLL